MNDRYSEPKNRVFLGTFERSFNPDTRRWSLKPCWGRIITYLAALAFVAFILVVCAIYSVSKFVKGFDDITITDAFMAPFDMTTYRQKVGECNIRKAREYFSRGDVSLGFMNLTAGVARSPNNLEARVTLATIHAISLKNIEQASMILEAKLPEAFKQKNGDYISIAATLFARNPKTAKKSILLLSKALKDGMLTDKKVLKILADANKYFGSTDKEEGIKFFSYAAKELSADKKISKFATKCLAILYLADGRAQEANDALKRGGVKDGEVYETISIYNDIAMGNEIQALGRTLRGIRLSKNPSRFYSILIKICNEFGDERAKKYALRLSILSNLDEEAQVDNAVSTKQYDILQTLIADSKPVKLLKAIRCAGKYKDRLALKMCMGKFETMSESLKFTMQAAAAEAMLSLGDNDAASKIIEELASRSKTPKQDSIVRDLRFASDISARTEKSHQVREFVEGMDKERIISFVDLIEDIGRGRYGVEILLSAIQSGKDNSQRAKTRLIEILCSLGDYPHLVEAIVESNVHVPVYVLTAEGISNPYSDKFIFIPGDKRKKLAEQIEKAREKKRKYEHFNLGF